LSEIEQVVASVEQACSLEAAADRLRSDAITLPSAVRWVRRRVAAVRTVLTIVVGLFPQCLEGCAPKITDVRARLACEEVLVFLRELAQIHLRALAAPLGFLPPPVLPGKRKLGFQHDMGPDPPAGFG